MRFLFAIATALFIGGAAIAQSGEIRGTIERQLDAFNAEDVGRAFSFASPSIQSMFGSPERFGIMVREGYPMVWRNSETRFGELREIEGALWQRVQIRDRRGIVHALDYMMVPGPEGWRIGGVRILPKPDPAV